MKRTCCTFLKLGIGRTSTRICDIMTVKEKFPGVFPLDNKLELVGLSPQE